MHILSSTGGLSLVYSSLEIACGHECMISESRVDICDCESFMRQKILNTHVIGQKFVGSQ